jgi:4-hydroxy-2-oxoheptanedioate aldolase
MDNLQKILLQLKDLGCSGVKISYEDEGALLNEIITMRYLTASTGLELSVKIGGCEAKRDIVDCINIGCDAIVAPMIESAFSLKKYFNSLKQYNYTREKGFNLETINAYQHLDELAKEFHNLDFVTFGRVDFVGSLNKDRVFVNTDEMFQMVSNVFTKAKEHNTSCYLGGAISIDSKDFIGKLIEAKLLDKFETRYIIFDVYKIDFTKLEQLLYFANVFEVEWLKYVSARYNLLANKDAERIVMIENRINMNKH